MTDDDRYDDWYQKLGEFTTKSPMTDERKVPQSALIHANEMLREESQQKVDALKRVKALEAEYEQFKTEAFEINESLHLRLNKAVKAIENLKNSNRQHMRYVLRDQTTAYVTDKALQRRYCERLLAELRSSEAREGS